MNGSICFYIQSHLEAFCFHPSNCTHTDKQIILTGTSMNSLFFQYMICSFFLLATHICNDVCFSPLSDSWVWRFINVGLNTDYLSKIHFHVQDNSFLWQKTSSDLNTCTQIGHKINVIVYPFQNVFFITLHVLLKVIIHFIINISV